MNKSFFRNLTVILVQIGIAIFFTGLISKYLELKLMMVISEWIWKNVTPLAFIYLYFYFKSEKEDIDLKRDSTIE